MIHAALEAQCLNQPCGSFWRQGDGMQCVPISRQAGYRDRGAYRNINGGDRQFKKVEIEIGSQCPVVRNRHGMLRLPGTLSQRYSYQNILTRQSALLILVIGKLQLNELRGIPVDLDSYLRT